MVTLRSVTPLAAALFAVAGGLAGGVVTASAYSTGGVSAGPLHWDPSNPATRSYYIPTVAPGGTFSDQMRVQNPNDDSVDLDVNAVDGITAVPTGAVYANRTDPVTEAGAWVTPAVSSMTIAAHSDTQVGFTVQVPADASPGDHLAGIAFENAHPTPGNGPISISSVVRAVVGILIKVPGPAAFHITVSNATIQPLSSANLASVVITTTDDGGLLGKPRFTVSLAGPDGYAKTVSRQFDTMLPQDTIPLPFPWPDKLVPGIYDITVTAAAAEMTGTVSYSGAFTLSNVLTGVPLPQTVSSRAATGDPPGKAPAPATSSATGSALPTWVMLLMIGTGMLLVGLVALGLVLLRMVRKQRSTKEAGPTQPASLGR